MKKILLAMVVNDMSINGISAVIMNYCERLDKDKFDISIISGAPVDPVYYSRCDKAGIRIVELPPRKLSPKAYYKALWKALSAKYSIVHVHGNSATMGLALSIAKWCHITVRIAHSHNSVCRSTLLHRLLLPMFRSSYTHAFACSKLAGDWIFGEDKYTIINNGIDVERYKFNQEIRKEIRRELSIENHFVIGHIGRFNCQKNHTFLVDIFNEILQSHPEARLLLLGGGDLYHEIEDKVNLLGIQEKVVFAGVQQEGYRYYNAMDCFVLPSLYEGLPVVGIEAQVNGLKCFFSAEMTEEVKVLDSVEFLSIAKKQIWASRISEEIETELGIGTCNEGASILPERLTGYAAFGDSRYSIAYEAEKLSSAYEKYDRTAGD